MDDAPIAVILPEPLAGEVRSLLAAGEPFGDGARSRAAPEQVVDDLAQVLS